MDFNKVDVKSILNNAEARQRRIRLESYNNTVEKIFSAPSADNRDASFLTVICFEKTNSNYPIALTVLRERDVARCISELGSSRTLTFPQTSNRLRNYEVEFVVRRTEFKAFRLGDISLSCGIDSVLRFEQARSDRPRTLNIWLVVAGGFNNTQALCLYMNYGFVVRGIHTKESAPFMMLETVDATTHAQTRTRLQRILEERFLLPDLKRRRANIEVKKRCL